MIDRKRTFFAVLLALLIYPGDNLGGAFQPKFLQPLANLTIPVGREAVFTCHVEHLGGYRVGWVKADTKAIQAIHEHVITHNPRVSVSHGDHSAWSLRIKGAQKEDEGLYMCQINTDPMKSQTGRLSIEVPPDFIDEDTSTDVTVREGWHVKLKCRATGIPTPKIIWRREDQKEIIIRESFHDKSTSSNEKVKVHRVQEWVNEELQLNKIKRDQMGVYNCIASNGVPPAIIKRIIVEVHFPPVIQVPNQLVGAPLGTDVVLECLVEACPQSINYWSYNNGVMIISNGRHDVQVVTKAPTKGHHNAHPNFNFKVKMLLTIRNFTKQDVGTYKCSAKNSNGDFESSIRLYDITSAVKPKPLSETIESNIDELQQPELEKDNRAENDPLGDTSAEVERTENNRPLPLDNPVQGHVDATQISISVTNLKTRGKRPVGQQSTASNISASLILVSAVLIYCR